MKKISRRNYSELSEEKEPATPPVNGPKILISACLLGELVRYDGGHCQVENELLERWARQGRLIPICPEVAGGLPVPRTNAEIVGGTARDVLDGKARVLDASGRDVTEAFLLGAKKALEEARKHQVEIAILKDHSPSCGTTMVYDGRFRGRKIPGLGITAALLKRHGIRVFSEKEIEKIPLAR